MKFISIDFETANEKRHSPCAIGIVVANEKEIVDEFYSLINPMTSFSTLNTYIHGIQEKDVMDAPTFPELWPKLREYIWGELVIAHNASFDMSVIRNTLDHYQLSYPQLDYLCTVKLSQKVWPDLENHKLNTLAAFHGFELEHHHALEDARVAARIMMKLFEKYETSSVDTILEHFHMAKGKIYERGYVPPKVKRARKKRKLYIK
ncbi:3'-5' exonuclease [Oceanobacillus senegalensis]|uniref:3'-5' exonuclease n=1 Tax=Oceanobacillus senegalensis TaxID=1936063 RepID=UPI000A30A8BB|nr:3'-5' exonuclease [Oceanobacillus senegalensis]